MPSDHRFQRADHARTAGAPRRSTCWWSAAASPAPAWRSTPPAAGLRTALVERDDFASGTSSKSSKLVHGGLRYLQQGEVRLVYEALRERQRLRRNAPHLVRVLPFMIPILTKDGVVSRKIARALGLGDVDVRPHRRLAHRQVPQRLRKDAAFAHLPTMPKERLASAYLYYDAAADDARLVLTVARTAAAARRGGGQPLRASSSCSTGRRRPRAAAPWSRPTAGASPCAPRSS